MVYLALNKVTNACFGHDRNSDRGHDLADHFWVGHAGDSSFSSDICWDSFQCHDSDGTGFFSNSSLCESVTYIQYGFSAIEQKV